MDMGLQEWGAIAGVVALAGAVGRFVWRRIQAVRTSMAAADNAVDDLSALLAESGSSTSNRADVGFYSASTLAQLRFAATNLTVLATGLIVVAILLEFDVEDRSLRLFRMWVKLACALSAIAAILMAAKMSSWTNRFSRRVESLWMASIKKRLDQKRPRQKPPANRDGAAPGSS